MFCLIHALDDEPVRYFILQMINLFAAVFLLSLASISPAVAGGGSNDDGSLPALMAIPEGAFIAGSDAAEREAAYGHSVTRKNRWYDSERLRQSLHTPAYRITKTTITNAQYAAFIAATGHPAPDVDKASWKGYRLVHPYSRSRPFAWAGAALPSGREQHPVVLVSHGDAVAYAAWLSAKTKQTWRLPSEIEWEKAVRGVAGAYFPWGNEFDGARLNSHDAGPFSTLPVGSFPAGAGPFGLLDGAGQVFEWTSTPKADGRYLVKGGSWDDKGCGFCRPAARHGRPEGIKHILIGFRLVVEGDE